MINLKILILVAVCYSGFLDARYEKIPGVKKAPVIASLFEWNFNDIADECETFLAPFGYSAVQVSPVFEHAVISRPWWDRNVERPWYERYQPISFKINSRSGNSKEFKMMVKHCNAVGVRVIVDVEINHMSTNVRGRGTAGSAYDGPNFYYPEAEFDSRAFHLHDACPTRSLGILDRNDLIQVKNCESLGRHDLDHKNPRVFKTIVKKLQKLLDLGVAGFRISTAKNIWPVDLDRILAKLQLGSEFSSDEAPFIANDVQVCCYCGENQVVNPDQYSGLGRVSEYSFRSILAGIFTGTSEEKLSRIAIILAKEKLVAPDNAFVFTDNHELQRVALHSLNFRQAKQLKMATAFMLAWPYGNHVITRMFEMPNICYSRNSKHHE